MDEIRELTKTLQEHERRLRQESEMFKEIFNNLREAVAIVNRDFTYYYVNQSYADMAKKKIEEINGRNIQQVWPDSYENIYKQLSKPFEDDEVHYSEHVSIRSDGSQVKLYVRLIPFSDKVIAFFLNWVKVE